MQKSVSVRASEEVQKQSSMSSPAWGGVGSAGAIFEPISGRSEKTTFIKWSLDSDK